MCFKKKSIPEYSSIVRDEVSMGQPENGTKVLKSKERNESCNSTSVYVSGHI